MGNTESLARTLDKVLLAAKKRSCSEQTRPTLRSKAAAALTGGLMKPVILTGGWEGGELVTMVPSESLYDLAPDSLNSSQIGPAPRR